MKQIVPVLIAALALGGVTVGAHHSYADFYLDQKVTIEGDIEELQYANPHVVFRIRTSDSTLYTVTWLAATQLEYRARVMRATFQVGDHLIVSGAPHRNTAVHEISAVKEVRRPSDGWHWGVS